jgi:hypothetical protein
MDICASPAPRAVYLQLPRRAARSCLWYPVGARLRISFRVLVRWEGVVVLVGRRALLLEGARFALLRGARCLRGLDLVGWLLLLCRSLEMADYLLVRRRVLVLVLRLEPLLLLGR